jgi:hypothetical protein
MTVPGCFQPVRRHSGIFANESRRNLDSTTFDAVCEIKSEPSKLMPLGLLIDVGAAVTNFLRHHVFTTPCLYTNMLVQRHAHTTSRKPDKQNPAGAGFCCGVKASQAIASV